MQSYYKVIYDCFWRDLINIATPPPYMIITWRNSSKTLLACVLLTYWLFISTSKAHILHDNILNP